FNARSVDWNARSRRNNRLPALLLAGVGWRGDLWSFTRNARGAAGRCLDGRRLCRCRLRRWLHLCDLGLALQLLLALPLRRRVEIFPSDQHDGRQNDGENGVLLLVHYLL